MPREVIERQDDLIAINLVAPLLLGISALMPSNPLGIILGLALLLFCPGYATGAFIFPTPRDLNVWERFALSLGFSVSELTVLGILLNRTPWKLNQVPIVLSVALVIGCLSLLAAAERRRLGVRAPFQIGNTRNGQRLKAEQGWYVVTIVSLLVLGLLAFEVGGLVARGGGFTEFFILGSGGKAGPYPHQVEVARPTELVLGIVNHEPRTTTYRVRVSLGSDTLVKIDGIKLDPGKKWVQSIQLVLPLRVILPTPQKRKSVDFLLFREGSDAPYRILHLWVRVVRGPLKSLSHIPLFAMICQW